MFLRNLGFLADSVLLVTRLSHVTSPRGEFSRKVQIF